MCLFVLLHSIVELSVFWYFSTSPGEMKKGAADDVAWPRKLCTELGVTTFSYLSAVVSSKEILRY